MPCFNQNFNNIVENKNLIIINIAKMIHVKRPIILEKKKLKLFTIFTKTRNLLTH